MCKNIAGCYCQGKTKKIQRSHRLLYKLSVFLGGVSESYEIQWYINLFLWGVIVITVFIDIIVVLVVIKFFLFGYFLVGWFQYSSLEYC
jgi:hypothetical protein